MAKTKKLIPPVRSLGDLARLARTDPRYEKLAMTAASNLGSPALALEAALRYLANEAMETDEDGVVGEVNFCRDLVD